MRMEWEGVPHHYALGDAGLAQRIPDYGRGGLGPRFLPPGDAAALAQTRDYSSTDHRLIRERHACKMTALVAGRLANQQERRGYVEVLPEPLATHGRAAWKVERIDIGPRVENVVRSERSQGFYDVVHFNLRIVRYSFVR